MIHAGAAWEDFHRVQQLAQDGWLGFEDDPATPFAFGLRLWETIGPVLLVAAVGVVVALRRRERSDVVLLSFAAAYALSLVPSHAHFDRYVLPLVPVLAVVAGRFMTLAVAALVACLVPLWWSVGDARSLTGRDPRLDAAAWVDTNIPFGDRIAADTSTLPLRGRAVVRLALPGPGRPFDTRRDLAMLRVDGVHWIVLGGSSPTASSPPPRTIHGKPASTAPSSACNLRTRRGASRAAVRARGSASTAWMGSSTGSAPVGCGLAARGRGAGTTPMLVASVSLRAHEADAGRNDRPFGRHGPR